MRMAIIALIVGLIVGGILGVKIATPTPITPIILPTVDNKIKEEYHKIIPIVTEKKTVRVSKRTIETLPTLPPIPGADTPVDDEVEIPLPVEIINYVDTSKEYIENLEKINKELEIELIKYKARTAYLESQHTGLAWKIGSFSVGLILGSVL